MGSRATDNAADGIVRPGEVLTAEAARRCLGIGAWGWRQFQTSIPRFKIGRQTYCLSDDVIAECKRRRDEQNQSDDIIAECERRRDEQNDGGPACAL